jgi:hypothetical protein
MFLVIMLMACVVLIRLFVQQKFDTKDIQAEILVNGLIYSSGGAGYYDSLTGRNYPQIIDLEQLNSTELEQSFYFPNNNLITAKIYVSRDREDETGALKTAYYNKRWYDNWKPLLRANIPGIGGVTEYKKTLPVIYIDSSREEKTGYVTYEVVQPRG